MPPANQPPELPPAAGDGEPRTTGLKRRYYLAGLVIAAALAIYTTHKLHRMAQIRGIVGDAAVERRLVTGKRHYPGRRREICLLSWSDQRAGRASTHEVEADCDYWGRTRIGAPIELVHVHGDDGDDDGDVYLRDGEIYTSVGNFCFDFALLAAELAAAIYCARRLRRGAAEPQPAS
ncbi:MAG TPA: hypothetical protein VFT22_32810 [Kofleriaceae bacterium]|nr:hypothetical protein [Kofleriaceae bacterium]